MLVDIEFGERRLGPKPHHERPDRLVLAQLPTAMARLVLSHMYELDETGERFAAARSDLIRGLFELPRAASQQLAHGPLQIGEAALNDIVEAHGERSLLNGIPPSYRVEEAYDLESFAYASEG